MDYLRILLAGVPCWLYENGTVLPVMVGGNGDNPDTPVLGEDGGGSGLTLGSSAIGLDLFFPDGTYAGRLVRGRVPFGGGEAPLFLSIPGSETEGAQIIPFAGGSFMAQAGGGKAFSLAINSEGGIARSAIVDVSPSGGSSSQQLASQQAGDIAAMERLSVQLQAEADEAAANRDFAKAQAALDRKADIDAAKLAAENALKLTLISEGGALERELANIQSRALDVRAEMIGKNPFRGAVRQAGGVPRGVDPFQAFMAENQSVIDREAPTLDATMTPAELQAALDEFNVSTPSPGNIIGLAHGGDVGVGETVRVGELGTELVKNMGQGRVKVIPENELGSQRVVASAQEGGEFDFDKSTIQQVLGPVFAHLGFNKVPRLPSKGKKFTSLEKVNRLGIRPRLIRNPSNGAIFFVDTQGRRRLIRNMQEFRDFGFKFRDVVNLRPGDFQSFERGNVLTSAPPLFEQHRAFAPQAVPLRLPKELGGFALPAPRTFANLFRNFGGANRRIILDALGLSELQAEEALEEIQAFTPRGTAGARVAFA